MRWLEAATTGFPRATPAQVWLKLGLLPSGDGSFSGPGAEPRLEADLAPAWVLVLAPASERETGWDGQRLE